MPRIVAIRDGFSASDSIRTRSRLTRLERILRLPHSGPQIRSISTWRVISRPGCSRRASSRRNSPGKVDGLVPEKYFVPRPVKAEIADYEDVRSGMTTLQRHRAS